MILTPNYTPIIEIVNYYRMIIKKMAGYGIWLLALLLGFSVIRSVGKVGNVRRDILAEKARVEKLKKENEDLQKELALTTDVNFIEKEVRNKLGLTKAGETEVVLPDAETLKKLAPEPAGDTETLPDPVWKRWLKMFI